MGFDDIAAAVTVETSATSSAFHSFFILHPLDDLLMWEDVGVVG